MTVFFRRISPYDAISDLNTDNSMDLIVIFAAGSLKKRYNLSKQNLKESQTLQFVFNLALLGGYDLKLNKENTPMFFSLLT
jgi:hypothetical protein